jgi:hypothetical protein
MGSVAAHPVEKVSLELEEAPFAALRLRYEYRPQLLALGVISDKRASARGFITNEWCPEP